MRSTIAEKTSAKSEPKPTKKKGAKKVAASLKTKKVTAKPERKFGALDAAAKVLAESSEPMTSKALIEAMVSKGYWTSPGGQAPHAKLYAAISREINLKGDASRFAKVDRGQFTLSKGAKSADPAK